MTAPKPWFWKGLLLLAAIFVLVNLLTLRTLRKGTSDVVEAAPPPPVRFTEEKSKEDPKRGLQQRFRMLRIGGQDPFHLEPEKKEDIPGPPKAEETTPAPVEEAPFVPNVLLTATVLMPNGESMAIMKAGSQEQIVRQGEEIQGMVLDKVARDYVMVSQGSRVAKIELFPMSQGGGVSRGSPAASGRSGPPNRGPGQGPPGPQTPAELNAGMNPTLMRAMKHRPPEDWTGLRLRMDYTSPDNGKILVIGISRRHPAYRAGVRDGDVVQSINGVKPNDLEEAFEMLSNVQPGTGAVVAIQRGGFSGTMTLERPRSEP